MLHLGKKHVKPGHIEGDIRRPGLPIAIADLSPSIPKRSPPRNFTQCDSLLIGDATSAHTTPYIESKNPSALLEHEATTSRVSEEQLFYCRQRGIGEEEAVALIVNGFCREVLQKLPMEFAVEAQQLVGISLEGSIG